MPEEANHLCVRGGAGEGHVAISEGAIDLHVEARFSRGISVLSGGLHSVSGQVEVEAVGTDLRSGYLQLRERERKGKKRTSNELSVIFDIIILTLTIYLLTSKSNS